MIIPIDTIGFRFQPFILRAGVYRVFQTIWSVFSILGILGKWFPMWWVMNIFFNWVVQPARSCFLPLKPKLPAGFGSWKLWQGCHTLRIAQSQFSAAWPNGDEFSGFILNDRILGFPIEIRNCFGEQLWIGEEVNRWKLKHHCFCFLACWCGCCKGCKGYIFSG